MRTKILTKLYAAKGESVEGENFVNEFDINEVALCEHIEALAQEGYDITGEFSKGYCLNNWQTVIIPNNVRSKLSYSKLFKQVIFYPSLGSTNDYAKELATNGAVSGTVIVAGKQTAGKGRMERKWESPLGGLWFSIILKPLLPLHKLPLLSLVLAVAIADGIEQYSGLPNQVKWPNDVILAGKKVAGILLEVNSAANDELEIIVGIGVNLNQEDFGEELNDKAISLKQEIKRETLSMDILPLLLAQIEYYYDEFITAGFEAIRPLFKARCNHLGKKISLNQQDKLIEGINTDIDSQGSLVLTTGGQEIRLTTGDVKVI